jgi:putative polyketide hydroxylase
MTDIDVPVLVVGGGPTGLALSLALSKAGTGSLLVDKHAGTSVHPKATVVNVRTMELCRQWGVDAEIERAGISMSVLRCVCWSTTLAGHEIGRIELGAGDPTLAANAAHSPVLPVMCPQDVIEPILRRAASSQPLADVRYGHELRAFAQDAGGVTAEILDVATGGTLRVRSAYLVGCDGRASRVREALGIPLGGEEPLGDMLNIYFRADLTHLVAHRLSPLYWIVNPDTPGVIITLNGSDRWLLNIPYDAVAESPDDYPAARCLALARRAIGDAAVDIEVLSINPWQMTRLVAERFRDGRVFLAGDAAHQFPPTGGHGMNAGIQDAHNLAWKLGAVLGRWAGPDLLGSYDAERRPLAHLLTRESVGNAAALKGRLKVPPEIEHDDEQGRAIRGAVAEMVTRDRGHFISTGLTLGAAYRSGAIVASAAGGAAAERALDVEHYVPVPLAGYRAPHLVVERAGRRLSSLDLFGDAVVVLTGPDGDAWAAAVAALRDRSRVPVRCERVGVDLVDVEHRFASLYGVAPGGAVVVRPDGYIMWRADDQVEDPAAALGAVLGQVFG